MNHCPVCGVIMTFAGVHAPRRSPFAADEVICAACVKAFACVKLPAQAPECSSCDQWYSCPAST